MVFWLTGLSGAGKSTLAQSLAVHLRSFGYPVLLLDGDVARQSLNSDLGFSMADRDENVRRLASCAALAELSNIIVCVACISPLARQREQARSIINDFHEIYVSSSIETCMCRDPKGYYKRIEHGEIKNYTGISSPYEIPLAPALVVDTENETECVSATKMIDYALKMLGQKVQA